MTPPKYVTLDVRPKGFAICTLCRPPVNAMNLDFWNHLQDALDAAEANPHVHGVVLVSGLDRNVFTAGNDLMELHARYSSRKRYQQFWETVNICLSRLYRSPLVTVAAVRGACPAGGCALSLCCDYRIITRDTKIGLNEVQLGIPVPKYWALLMARAVGATVSERLLFSGEMIGAEAAKKVGMVNDVVDRHQELLPMAESTIAELLSVDVAARAGTKHHLRNEFSRDWEAYCVEEASHGWELLAKPETMAQMDKKLQQLGGGSKSATRSRL